MFSAINLTETFKDSELKQVGPDRGGGVIKVRLIFKLWILQWTLIF